jgi:hypothetical protein
LGFFTQPIPGDVGYQRGFTQAGEPFDGVDPQQIIRIHPFFDEKLPGGRLGKVSHGVEQPLLIGLVDELLGFA